LPAFELRTCDRHARQRRLIHALSLSQRLLQFRLAIQTAELNHHSHAVAHAAFLARGRRGFVDQLRLADLQRFLHRQLHAARFMGRSLLLSTIPDDTIKS